MSPMTPTPSSDCRPLRSSVSGWGRFPVGETDLYRPERLRSLTAALGCSDSVLARGLGRSYGDACYNTAGATVLMERLNRFLSFDSATGILECEPGVTFLELLRHFVPRGFFPPVTPGTKFVTLGGALACDVHGKNHHLDGSFSNHVLDFDLLTASGEILPCSRTENPQLFRGTVGGLGLTGVVTRIRLRLRPIETSYVVVDYERAVNLDDALDRLEARDDAYAYSVAWIDCLARGPAVGRSVLMRGNPARPEEVRHAGVGELLRGGRPQRLRVPLDAPELLLNRSSIRAFNALYYRRYPVDGRGRLVHFEPFFYPLDGIGDWNRLYGRRGFVQYQLLLPPAEARAGLLEALEVLSASGAPSFLAVLKRFGAVEESGLLSFPRPGFTLALDLPWRGEPTETLLDKLDRMVLAKGGRVYLAKDARLGPERVADMYPDLNAWREIKATIDPESRFSSDLSRRTGLAW
jgi:decaprenylphospho-beta-D-ribofuranose 2-oxidase